MASVTYDKCIMANVIMAKIFMAKILWQMKLSLTEDSMNLLHRLWLLLVRIHNLVRDGLAAALSCVLGAPGVKGCPGLG